MTLASIVAAVGLGACLVLLCLWLGERHDRRVWHAEAKKLADANRNLQRRLRDWESWWQEDVLTTLPRKEAE